MTSIHLSFLKYYWTNQFDASNALKSARAPLAAVQGNSALVQLLVTRRTTLLVYTIQYAIRLFSCKMSFNLRNTNAKSPWELRKLGKFCEWQRVAGWVAMAETDIRYATDGIPDMSNIPLMVYQICHWHISDIPLRWRITKVKFFTHWFLNYVNVEAIRCKNEW